MIVRDGPQLQNKMSIVPNHNKKKIMKSTDRNTICILLRTFKYVVKVMSVQ